MLVGENMPQSLDNADALRQLNLELTQEIASRQAAEQQLLLAQAALELSVNERTLELEAALEALQKSQERLELALDASQLALWDWNLVSDEIHHTQAEAIFGLKDHQIRGVLTDLRPLLHPDDLPVLRNAMIEHMKQHTDAYMVEYRVKHTDGRWVWIEDRGRAIERDAHGRVLRMLGTRRDITQRKQGDEELRLASSVFDAGSESIVILDPYYTVLAVNKAFTTVTGFTRKEVVGHSIIFSKVPDTLRGQYQHVRACIERDGSWQGEILGLRKNGELYPQILRIHVVTNTQGARTHIVGFFTDLTIRRQAEERLSYLTQYDELTGLANRGLFHKRLQQAVEHARQVGERVVLLHLDLDRFKVLNDSLGVETADRVLHIMSQRLMQILPDANTVARLGGDEFAVILDGALSCLIHECSRSNSFSTV